ncbi:acyltransferase [Shewanella gelidimarina]|uniref:acyltransferase family protein n=1 Tax=Shewanella gelidimarina TaxID=56813 RepID=UPI00200FC332|nr:acyltransferase [Shewanella gelidimarina]MCL1057882.1 acyltransferase [Shewanella gelidimarina]
MNKRFDVLDSFRGIAALMVAVYHLHVVGFITELNFVRNSYLFVEFFFVLSGFVISYSYLGRLKNIVDVKLFMKKRFARLWPLHIFMMLMFIPFALANIILNIDLGDRFSLYSFVTNLFFIQSFGLHDGPTWNMPAWSVGVEFYTYIIFSFFCLNSYFRKGIIAPIMISALAFIALFTFLNVFDISIFRCIYCFFLGLIAFKLHSYIKVNSWMEVVAITFLVLILSVVRVQDYGVWGYLLLPILFLLIIIVFSHQQGCISKVLINPLFTKLGILSFSIYMTHTWLISLMKAMFVIIDKMLGYQFMHMINGSRIIDLGFGWVNDLLFIPYIAMVIFISSMTYNHVEKPGQKKINDF